MKQTMKKNFFAAIAIAFTLGSNAQTFTEWHDLEVNEINRYPAHTEVMSTTSKQLSLEGQWKFHWVRNADERPQDFFSMIQSYMFDQNFHIFEFL